MAAVEPTADRPVTLRSNANPEQLPPVGSQALGRANAQNSSASGRSTGFYHLIRLAWRELRVAVFGTPPGTRSRSEVLKLCPRALDERIRIENTLVHLDSEARPVGNTELSIVDVQVVCKHVKR